MVIANGENNVKAKMAKSVISAILWQISINMKIANNINNIVSAAWRENINKAFEINSQRKP
jgi:hypothetical protein